MSVVLNQREAALHQAMYDLQGSHCFALFSQPPEHVLDVGQPRALLTSSVSQEEDGKKGVSRLVDVCADG